jgi:hypothetical protein
VALAFHHGDWTRSAASRRSPGLAERIAAGVAAGRLIPAGANTWTLADLKYEGGAVQIASFELDELVIAPQRVMPQIAANHAQGQAQPQQGGRPARARGAGRRRLLRGGDRDGRSASSASAA